MDNLARPHLDDAFGASFVRTILSEGSLPVVAPLLAFLGNNGERPDLRLPAKAARAALLADIAHFMNISHGRHPGIVDYAAHKIVDDAARKWLVQAIDGVSAERTYLNKLTVTAGPIRRLNGQDKITALIEGQSKNFEMLATSDRKGCPAGAAIAFVVDWHQTRALLDRVALNIGLEAAPVALPSVDDCMMWQLLAARHIEMLAS
jgi:hypothetical protein